MAANLPSEKLGTATGPSASRFVSDFVWSVLVIPGERSMAGGGLRKMRHLRRLPEPHGRLRCKFLDRKIAPRI